MPYKQWAAYERLTADDLNGQFDWVRPRAARWYRSADGNNSANVWLYMGGMAALFDPDGIGNTSGIYTIPVAGLWTLDAEFTTSTTTVPLAVVGWKINGGPDPLAHERTYISGSPNLTATVAYRGYINRVMAAGDTVQAAFISATALTITDWWSGVRLVQRS